VTELIQQLISDSVPPSANSLDIPAAHQILFYPLPSPKETYPFCFMGEEIKTTAQVTCFWFSRVVQAGNVVILST
jgi:hypothetical protein